MFREDKGTKIVATRQVLAAVDFDLAACVVNKSDFPNAIPLAIGRQDAALNADIFSFEYSATRIERSPGRTLVSFEPYSHKGNIVRSFESKFPEKVKTQCFLTSFPALRGASGASILAGTLSKKNFAVVGMTVANVERHLMPAQVVQIHDGDLYRESTSYFLPFGKALARSVLEECLNGMGIPFSYAEDVECDGRSLREKVFNPIWLMLSRWRNSAQGDSSLLVTQPFLFLTCVAGTLVRNSHNQ